MGTPKTDYLGLRVTLAEKAVVTELVRRRLVDTGDETVSGWFRVVLRKEAKAAGLSMDEPIEPEAKPTARPPAKRPKRAARTGRS